MPVSAAESRSRASSRAPAWKFVCAAARARSARLDGIRRQRSRALEEHPGGSEAAPPLRTCCRPFQLRGNLLIGRCRRLRPVPSPAIWIDVRIRRLGERPVDLAPLLDSGCSIRRGPDERMAEDDPGTEHQQALRFDGARRRFGDAEELGGTSDRCRIADRVGRRHEQETSRFVGKSRQASREALLDTRRERHVGGQPEAARELRRRQAARQLEQRERIPARLVDDPVKHALIQWRRQAGLQQRPRVPVPQWLDAELREARERAAELARREHERDLLRQAVAGRRT